MRNIWLEEERLHETNLQKRKRKKKKVSIQENINHAMMLQYSMMEEKFQYFHKIFKITLLKLLLKIDLV